MITHPNISYPGKENGPGLRSAETAVRSRVLTPETLAVLEADPFGSWGYIFKHEGVATEMQNLFGRDEQTLIRPVYEVAMNEKKIIAGSIMVYAHILKIDPLIARRLAAIGQFSWGVIKAYDNILDGSLKRYGSPTHLAKEGLAKSLRASLSALLAVQKETINDSSFALDFLEMADVSMAADAIMSDFNWETPLEAYFPIMERMNKAFSWFLKVMGKISGQEQAATEFSRFQSNLLSLVQINNDVKNLMLPIEDDEPGIDLSVKIPSVLNSLRRFFTISHTFDHERKLIEEIVACDRKRSFLNRERMNEKRMMDIMIVLKIWNEHRMTALLSHTTYVHALYEGAWESLTEGFGQLTFPRDGISQAENAIVKDFFMANLNAVYRQFLDSMLSKN